MSNLERASDRNFVNRKGIVSQTAATPVARKDDSPKPTTKPLQKTNHKESPYANYTQETSKVQLRVFDLAKSAAKKCKEAFLSISTTIAEEGPGKNDLGNLYASPWRKAVDWDRIFETLAEFKTDMENYEPLAELLAGEGVFPNVNILLLGAIGAGKSSVFNTLNSVFRGKIFYVARMGSSTQSLTTKLTKYPIMSSCTIPVPLKFKFWDLQGLEPKHLITKENMRYILEGCIPDKFPLDPSGDLSPDMPGFIKNASLADKIHCVALVQDASVVDAMQDLNPEVTKNIKEMQMVMNSLDIPQVVILTKIDSICKDTKMNVGNALRSKNVEACVSKASDVLGLPKNAIFPMKNYETEDQLDPAVDILALQALKGILNNCDAHLFNHFEEIRKAYSVPNKLT